MTESEQVQVGGREPISLDGRLQELEASLIGWALKTAGGNKSRAARLLQIKRSTMAIASPGWSGRASSQAGTRQVSEALMMPACRWLERDRVTGISTVGPQEQESVFGERGQQAAAGPRIEFPQTLRLGAREAQPRHLQKLAANPAQRLFPNRRRGVLVHKASISDLQRDPEQGSCPSTYY
jgi:hypothetical protein